MDFRKLGSNSERTKVVILTSSYRIAGFVSLTPGARLTDFVTEAGAFLAITDADVMDHAGKSILSSSFINVNRDHVEIIVPEETT